VSIEAAPLDITQHTAQYELLRSQVIRAAVDAPRPDLAAQPRGFGLALLLREGMPAWLKAVDDVIHASLAERAIDVLQLPTTLHSLGHAIGPTWLSGVRPQDITSLLTSLVLSTRHVERSSSREGYQSCQ
jgi:hypothetical protein